MTIENIHTASDPVAVYDIMREAANRLAAVFAERVTVGGPEDPAIQRIREIWAEAQGVDTRDLQAQRALTARFSEQYVSLVGR